MIQEHNRLIDSLTQKMNLEKQKACEEEREFGRMRYQKQLERDEAEVGRSNPKSNIGISFNNKKGN